MTGPLEPLSPTDRTTVKREQDHAVTDRAALHALLREGLVAHLGVVKDDHPVVLPVAYAVDLDGPDDHGTLYVHGSVAADWLRRSVDATVCVTVTELDGLVLARSGFNSSMNYRSAVVIGTVRLVDDVDERDHALDLIVDHVVPGRAAALRRPTRKELAATAVLAVPLREASLKVSEGGPDDEPEDVEAGTWGGHVPLRRVADAPVSDPATPGEVPEHVLQRARDLGWDGGYDGA
ncbi:pyridoxamine 5'-phosphate oxidase family protein [Nocardioides taihuensis]|uniref:Pyridoxamine 5'-phosphate oxidase family protein n=1 Tax=Nocardioides taihuensis TaxID=1835606 RepID=A0ABW0BQZ5_9ACTN